MGICTVRQSKTQLSKLIEQAERGKDVVIARSDKPAVKLIPVTKNHSKRVSGSYLTANAAIHELGAETFW